jgi:hypothetical protein
LRKIRALKFWDNKSPEKKWHLNVVPTERHKIYYREGSGASSQNMQVVWSLCLKLSLLSPSHHFHLICIDRLFFLVMQINIILNFHLWIRPSPILELQHTFLPSKCYELRNVPQLFSFLCCFALGPTFGSLEEFGGVSYNLNS